MDAIHPVRVLLFWDSEIARDTYGPYFIGVVQKSWTLPTNRMISHTISSTQGINTINMTEHVTAITEMVSHEPSMLYTIVNDDDDEIDHSDEDYITSSQFESEDNNDAKGEELQSPVIPVTENTMAQWESSQWYSSTRYDYT
ncbi:hypothetical protein M9H77_21818 [Catharanthus roseus]|uniref:Uncharacterized protein n=1 Tax=Catharanthus roseus TaxID=4058 RepID=A0ACC0AQF9_CATRO|nr:hypothetical protein M9H77_21818 [Catharanthus roseus]